MRYIFLSDSDCAYVRIDSRWINPTRSSSFAFLAHVFRRHIAAPTGQPLRLLLISPPDEAAY